MSARLCGRSVLGVTTIVWQICVKNNGDCTAEPRLEGKGLAVQHHLRPYRLLAGPYHAIWETDHLVGVLREPGVLTWSGAGRVMSD